MKKPNMILSIRLFLYVFLSLAIVSECVQGPQFWGSLGFPSCDGDLQSPINIDTEEIPKYEYNDLFNFKHYDDVASRITVTNNGHTLMATFDYQPSKNRPSISGGQLGGTFEFEQLHFHWGAQIEKKYSGAEHTIDGVRAPLEMHMVHRNVKYNTMDQAVNHTDGILVLAALFEMNTNNVMPLLQSVDIVHKMVEPFMGNATLKPRPLSSVLPEDTTAFFRYRGSLTTPGCQESVEWVVFEHRAHVIVGQLNMLSKLRRPDQKLISHNFRPTQSVNARKIYHMVYKHPGQVTAESASAGLRSPLLAVYGAVAAVVLVCNSRL
ncbi:putative carbonic anhydrase 3 [Amphibalanus amphitrite]|uniref:Putative carbonic anhydrase 3 n=1 Tax=Amphibalanus amphitrite TaxID=1232801 RepID=A0A6A4WH85_AMPAM|nr:putative carbonic anhydrase 3 [Amphibalanus amphitrite]